MLAFTVSRWRESKFFFKVSDKMAAVADTDPAGGFFDRKKTCFQKMLRPLYSDLSQKFSKRDAGLLFEQMSQPGSRQIESFGKSAKINIPFKV